MKSVSRMKSSLRSGFGTCGRHYMCFARSRRTNRAKRNKTRSVFLNLCGSKDFIHSSEWISSAADGYHRQQGCRFHYHNLSQTNYDFSGSIPPTSVILSLVSSRILTPWEWQKSFIFSPSRWVESAPVTARVSAEIFPVLPPRKP